MSDVEYKIDALFGSVELRQIHKFENGKRVTYGYGIYRDIDGKETRRTDPEALSTLSWSSGEPFTQSDIDKLNDN